MSPAEDRSLWLVSPVSIKGKLVLYETKSGSEVFEVKHTERQRRLLHFRGGLSCLMLQCSLTSRVVLSADCCSASFMFRLTFRKSIFDIFES